MANCDNYRRIVKNQNLIEESRMLRISKKGQTIVPVIETITVLGRKEFALYAHRDSGKRVIHNDFIGSNKENFRVLLKCLARRDPLLCSHLKGSGKRDKYMSSSENKNCKTLLAATVDIVIKHKRIVDKQNNLANSKMQSTENYLNVMVFNPFLDFYIMEFGEKFTNHENIRTDTCSRSRKGNGNATKFKDTTPR